MMEYRLKQNRLYGKCRAYSQLWKGFFKLLCFSHFKQKSSSAARL